MRTTTTRRLALAATAGATLVTAMLTGLTGACNMLLDPTMATVPMAHDAAQGNAGMYHAVDVSGCS